MNCRGQTALRYASCICLLGLALAVPLAVGQEPKAPAPASSQAGGGAVPGQGAEQLSPPTAEHPESYLEFALAGGYLMIPIALASVLLLTFLVERLVSTRRGRVLPRAFVRGLQELQAAKTPPSDSQIESFCDQRPSCVARILKASLRRIDGPWEEVEQTVNNAAQREIHSLRRFVRLFAMIAAVTPLLGLLGTVIGMIHAFQQVAMQGLGSGQALAPGIYKALVTTAAGLIVAIPALIVYHWMMSRVDNYVHEMDALVVDFVEARRERKEVVTQSETEPATMKATVRV